MMTWKLTQQATNAEELEMTREACRIGSLTALITLLLSVTAVAQTALNVDGVAPARGNFSLKIDMDGSTNAAFVADESPVDETHYNAEVFIYIDSAFSMNFPSAAGADRFNLFRVKQTGQPGNVNPFRLLIRAGHAGLITAQGLVRVDSGALIGTQAIVVQTDKWQRLRLDWQASSAPGANDGYLRIRKGVGPVKAAENLDNDQMSITRIEVGVAGGLDSTTTGRISLDDFSSLRTTPADWP